MLQLAAQRIGHVRRQFTTTGALTGRSCATKGLIPLAHIRDRWERHVGGERVRTTRYGKGKRRQSRYRDPNSRERTKDFARTADAERFLATITADVPRGAFVDPNAGTVTFSDFAERWLDAQTFAESSREATDLRLCLHAIAPFGQRELRSIKPSVIQAWIRGLQQELAPSSRHSRTATGPPLSPPDAA